MAAIGASDVTYTIVSEKFDSTSRVIRGVTIAFGGSAATYPTGGIPLTKAKMGCPTNIESLSVVDPSSGDGYVWKYDQTNNKFRCYQSSNLTGGTAAALSEVATTATFAATTLKASVVGW